MTKQGYGSREYLVDDIWISGPKGKVRGVRFNLETVLPKVEDMAGIWKYIKERGIQTPEKPDKILEQLATARLLPERLRLFSPWGPRYNKDTPEIKESDPEIATLREVSSILNRFRESGYDIDFLLMTADAYGTEVNNLSKEFVADYFKYLEECVYREVGKAGVSVKAWSSIRDEQRTRYDELVEEIDRNFYDWIKEGEYKNSLRVAKFFNPDNAEESSRRYCIERLTEGNIINEIYYR